MVNTVLLKTSRKFKVEASKTKTICYAQPRLKKTINYKKC